MKTHHEIKDLLRTLPGVDRMLEWFKADPFFEEIPRSLQVGAARSVIDALRAGLRDPDIELAAEYFSEGSILKQVKLTLTAAMMPNLRQVINATGVIIHTNLGRSLLAEDALVNLQKIAGGYSNLEFDLSAGRRGSRYSSVEDLICEISRAEAAMVVNNNAGAVLLCLETIASGKRVIVSRGELVEIGGSFRIPDVMTKSGAVLKEVGTTNRTHLRDYENAIDKNTGLLLKVHTSNYSVVGFTSGVSLKELVALGKRYHLPVMEDLGSGTFIDLSEYGLQKEPTVQDAIATGVDVISFSGDKLLGGPQTGVIAGTREMLEKVKQNPITRALRIDKLTLAALEATLRLYRDQTTVLEKIPTLRMLTMPSAVIQAKTERLLDLLADLKDERLAAQSFEAISRAGGGSLPMLQLPSRCVGVKIQGVSANRIDKWMREAHLPVIGRIEDNFFMMDVRTVKENELAAVSAAFGKLLEESMSVT
jgi:L-seryl-tRNA(Ser) seleniumtransferase